MKRKQFLALLTVCVMLFGLAGCQGDIDTEQADTEQPVPSAETASDTEAEDTTYNATDEESVTKKSDENGNSETDIIRSCLYVDGKQVTLPCTLEEFGGGFEIIKAEDDLGEPFSSEDFSSEDFYIDESGNSFTSYMGSISYNDVDWGLVNYTIADDGEYVIWSLIIAAWYDDNDYSKIKVNNEAYLGGDYNSLSEIGGNFKNYTAKKEGISYISSDNIYNTKLDISVGKDSTVRTIVVSVTPTQKIEKRKNK